MRGIINTDVPDYITILTWVSTEKTHIHGKTIYEGIYYSSEKKSIKNNDIGVASWGVTRLKVVNDILRYLVHHGLIMGEEIKLDEKELVACENKNGT